MSMKIRIRIRIAMMIAASLFAECAYAQGLKETHSEIAAFTNARTLVVNKEWSKAEAAFKQLIAEHPESKDVSAALYWLALAQKKQDKFKEADNALEQLIKDHPLSEWVNDARQMRLEMANRLGRTDLIVEETASSEDEIRIVALQSLFQADPARATNAASDILRRGSKASPRLREAAVTLLGQYGGKEALPILIELARNEQDAKLRKKAIAALGWRDSEEAFNLLRDIARGEDEIAEAALIAITGYPAHRERAYAFLVELAKSGKMLKSRKLAISALGRYSGDKALGELVGMQS